LVNCTSEELIIKEDLVLKHKNLGYQEGLIDHYGVWMLKILIAQWFNFKITKSEILLVFLNTIWYDVNIRIYVVMRR